MKTFRSLTTTLIWSMLIVALLSAGLVGTIWIHQEYKKFTKELTDQKQEYIARQKAAIKEEVLRVMDYINYERVSTEHKLQINIKEKVEEAISIAANLYKSNHYTKSDEEIQTLIKEALRPIRFNVGRGYFFIYDMQGNNILFPHSPQLEGTNLMNLQDSKGQFPIQRIIKMVKEQGEGFLRWHWYKPGETNKMSEKIGFGKYFEPYDWLIGTGEYIEDFEKDVQKETLDYINTIRFGKDGYIFVYDFNAITLAHFHQKNLGVDRWNFQDPNGLFVLRELISISQQEKGGFLEYVGTIRPSTGFPASKIAYARAVMDWKWMVGSGVYVDTINEILAKQRLALIKKIKKTALFISGVLALSLILIGLLSRFFAKKTMENITIFSHFFEKASTDAIMIEDKSVHFSEFKTLAISANKMIDERNRAADSLEQMREKLARSEKMEALGVLAGGVAHDLNNLLTAMIAYPDLILNDLPENSPHRKYIKAIQDSGHKMASIVQDLLTLARRGVIQKVALSLNNVIENYLQSPEHQDIITNHPDIQITTNLQPDLLQINGSHIHLQTTIMNLVSNAAEAQPNGGSIHLATNNIFIEQTGKQDDEPSAGDYVLLSIKDEGLGINDEDIEKIFDPFFSKKHLGQKSGTGLGMAVVWGTVKDHDGYIKIFTELNKGTTFKLYFPVCKVSRFDQEELNDIGDIRGKGEKIMVVDDMQEQRDLAKALLIALGYSVETAASGEEALEYLQAEKVDLLLLDMIMDPGIDGLETFKRSLSINAKQKAIIVSGYTETDRVRAAKNIGAGQYVKKPYTITSIGKAVKEELQKQA